MRLCFVELTSDVEFFKDDKAGAFVFGAAFDEDDATTVMGIDSHDPKNTNKQQ
jgi:hypothetical protein